MLVAAAGCARDGGACGSRCGTAVIVINGAPDVLVPAFSRSDIGLWIGDQLFLRLADPRPDGTTAGDSGFVGRLAESWVVEDSLTLVFHLDPRARWHDGTPVTASDVVFSFDLYRDTLAGASSGPQLRRLAAVTARDSLTVAIRFAERSVEQFFDATHHVRVLPAHLLDTVPTDRIAQHPFGRSPVGNGPYRFVRWAGDIVELEADSTFFLGAPDIARLIWRVTPDPTAAVTTLLGRDADIHPRLGGPEDEARLAASPDFRVLEYPSLSYVYLSFNLRQPPFSDRGLRQALALAIDRDAIVATVLAGHGAVPRGPISPGVWAWTDSLRQLPFDSAAARERLNELGWRDTDGDGVRDRQGRALAFDLLVPSSSLHRTRTAVIMQEQFRRLGVAVRIVELENNAFYDRYEGGQYVAALGGRFVDPTPAGLLEFWTTQAIEHGYNAEGYRSARFDSLAWAAAGARDLPTARRLWHAAIATLNADAPGVWLYTPTRVAAVHARFQAVTLMPENWHTLLWTWRLDRDRLLPRDHVAPR